MLLPHRQDRRYMCIFTNLKLSEVKKKAQMLKVMCDYSFLLSDDADIPSSAKEEHQLPASQNASAPKSAHRSSKSRPPMEAASKCRPSTGASLKSRPLTALKLVSNRPELKSSASKNVQSQAREAQAKGAPINKPRPGVAEARKGSGGITTNGSG